MSAEALLRIAQRWARTLAPPRTLLQDLHGVLVSSMPSLSGLRLLVPNGTDYSVIAATENTRGGDLISLVGDPALTTADNTQPRWNNQRQAWYVPVSSVQDSPGHGLLEASGIAPRPAQADVDALMLAASVIATAFDLREMVALKTEIQAINHKSPARDTMNERLHFTLKRLDSAHNLGQMAETIAREMLVSENDALAINELKHNANGSVDGWQPIRDDGDTFNKRRSLTLELPWMQLSASLRASLARGEPSVFAAFDAETKAGIGAQVYEQMVGWGVNSAAFFPISLKDRTVAVMIVMRRAGAALSPEAVAAFASLANRAGGYIAILRRNNESAITQNRIQKLNLLNERILTAESFDDVALAVADVLPIPISRVVLAMFSEPVTSDTLPRFVQAAAVVSRNGQEMSGDGYQDLGENLRGNRLFEQLHHEKPIVVDKFGKAGRELFGGIWERLDENASAAALIPLRPVKDSVSGVLIVAGNNAAQLRMFSQDLRIVGDRITSITSRLHQQRFEEIIEPEHLVNWAERLTHAHGRIEEMRTLREILPLNIAMVAWASIEISLNQKALNKYCLDAIIGQGNQQAQPQTGLLDVMDGAARAALLKQATHGGEIVQVYEDLHSLGGGDHHLPDNEIVLNELSRADFLPERDVFASAIVLGLVDEGHLIGRVFILFRSSFDDRPDLRVACRQIATILSLKERIRMSNSQDYNEESAVDLLNRVNHLSALLTKTRSEQALLQQTAQLLVERFDTHHVSVLMRNADGSATFMAEHPASGLKGSRLAADHHLLARIKAETKLLTVDTLSDPDIDSGYRRLLEKARIGRTNWIPMFDSADEWIGAVGMNLQSPDQPFSMTAMSSASTIVFQVSTLLESLRQVEGSRRQISQLRAMTGISQKIVTSANESEAFQAVVAGIADLLPADHATVFRADPRNGAMRLVALFSDGKSEMVETEAAFNLERTPVGAAIENGQIFDLPNLSQWQAKAHAAMSEAMSSSLAAPIRVLGEIVGAIEVDARQTHAFSAADRDVFEQLVLQIEAGLSRAAMLAGGMRAANTTASITKVDQAMSSESTAAGGIRRAAETTRSVLKARQVIIRTGQPPSPNDTTR